MKKNLYFDNNSYHLPNEKIIKEIYEKNLFFLPLNASSIHSNGQFAHKLIEDARDFILGLLTFVDLEKNFDNDFVWEIGGDLTKYIKKNQGSCTFYDLIFTSSATESNNLIIENAEKNFACDLFLCSASEHASVLERIKKTKNHRIISINEFSEVDEDELLKVISENLDKKIFLSLIYVNNETGVQNNLKSIISKIRKIHKNILIHSDLAQAIGKMKDINICGMDLDFGGFVGYKFGSLNGAGCLIFKKKFQLTPVLIGGGQESGKRSGTENCLAIHSMHKVLEEIYDNGHSHFDKFCEHGMTLRAHFENGLREIVLKKNSDDLTIFGGENESQDEKKSKDRRPIPTSYFALKNVKTKPAIIFLNHFEIYVGSGSACSAGLDIASYVLQSMGAKNSEEAIRVSFSQYNSVNDVNFLLEKLRVLYSKNFLD